MMNFMKYLWKVAKYMIHLNLDLPTVSHTIDNSGIENFFHLKLFEASINNIFLESIVLRMLKSNL